MIRGFKSIDRLSWNECQELLGSEQNPEVIEHIKKRLNVLAIELKAKDDTSFCSCKSVKDYQNYIQNFPKGSHINEAYNKIKELQVENDNKRFASCKTIDDFQHYLSASKNPLHRKEAMSRIEDLFWNDNRMSKSGCERYLAKYPNGRYVTEANVRIKSVVRRRIIWIVVLIIGAILFYLGYRPSGEVLFGETVNTVQYDSNNSRLSFTISSFSSPKMLTFPIVLVAQSSNSKTISFPKEGGSQEVTFSSNSSNDNIEISTTSSWISAKKNSNGKVVISVSKNEGEKRNGRVEIRAYSTLFGVRTGSNTGVIYVEQSSGHASYLSVSSYDLTFNQNGGTRSITVNTDGYWSIDDTPASWGHVSTSGNTITLRIDANKDQDRTSYFTLKSGGKTCRVNIAQSGIPATYLRLEKEEIYASIDGTGEGRCYPVTYYTDGKTIKAYTYSDWITVNVVKSSSRVEIEVASNSGARRSGNVYVKASGIEKTITVTQKGKTSSLRLEYSSWAFDTDSDYAVLTVSCNGDEPLSAKCSHDWITCSITSSGSLKVSVSENTGSSRRGTVYVESGTKSTSLSIYQKGYHSCPGCYNSMVGYSTGQVPYWYIDYNGYPHTGMSICKQCGGKGKIKD